MDTAQIGVIGGSGLYEIEGLTDVREIAVDTPYGRPSDNLVIGTLGEARIAFLPRHGRGHRISPSELPARANIWAMKSLGVTHLLSVSAVGSLREEIAPRDVVIPDQILDRTKGVRPVTFFDDGVVVHIAFSEPYCRELRAVVRDAALQSGVRVHDGGTMVVMEGPQFSTRAESEFHRQVGGDLIGMTALPEAKLAREAEICYATVAMVTDYDSWHATEEAVTVDMVVANLRANVDAARTIVRLAAERLGGAPRSCDCQNALATAIITAPEAISAERKEALRPLLGKYLP